MGLPVAYGTVGDGAMAVNNAVDLWSVCGAVWLCGALLGFLLPRPKWLESGLRSGSMLWSTPAGSVFRRVALVFHGAVIVRDVWQHFTGPRNIREYFLALWGVVCGQGWVLPQHIPEAVVKIKSGRQLHVSVSQAAQATPATQRAEHTNWYVTQEDLEFFQRSVEVEGAVEGATAWERMMDKQFPTFSYSAWRRTIKTGKTEYKSVTVAHNATAEEFMDFYLDDNTRPTWDTMISEHEVIENGPADQRCQVVRWNRHFPFAFITDREYVLARRVFKRNGCLYGISKAINHPRCPQEDGIVRMEVFYSMWRSRTIPCPLGSDQPACETVLLHHEEFKIPENLARFAVRHGMAGFVKKMGPAVIKFVEERRQRCDMFAVDADAYGIRRITRSMSSASSVSSLSSYTMEEGTPLADAAAADERFPERQLRRPRQHRQQQGPVRQLKRVGSLLAIASVAMAMQRSGSTARLAREGKPAGRLDRAASWADPLDFDEL